MKTKALWMALAFTATFTLASAKEIVKETTCQTNKKGCYVDANKNGVCDNSENKSCKKGNSKGLHDSSGHKKEKGNCCSQKGNKQANFVDANKNGVCDNKETSK